MENWRIYRSGDSVLALNGVEALFLKGMTFTSLSAPAGEALLSNGAYELVASEGRAVRPMRTPNGNIVLAYGETVFGPGRALFNVVGPSVVPHAHPADGLVALDVPEAEFSKAA